MIVNVNPFDTGYDENSHVMRFAALAREVYISPIPAPVQRMPPFPTLKSQGGKAKDLSSQRRKVTISMSTPGKGRKPGEAIVEIFEGAWSSPLNIYNYLTTLLSEDEPNDDDDNSEDDDEAINPLVDALFDEVETLRVRVSHFNMLSIPHITTTFY